MNDASAGREEREDKQTEHRIAGLLNDPALRQRWLAYYSLPENDHGGAGNDCRTLLIALERATSALAAERAAGAAGRPTWSDARSYLMQGASIQQDYAAGNYASYEEFAARIDAAAREIADGNRYAAIDRLRPARALAADREPTGG